MVVGLAGTVVVGAGTVVVGANGSAAFDVELPDEPHAATNVAPAATAKPTTNHRFAMALRLGRARAEPTVGTTARSNEAL
jgi:hypothetical protein